MKTVGRVLALFLAIVITFGMVPQSYAANDIDIYDDVPSTHWASDTIARWSGSGYNVLLGNGKGKFYPDNGITLGELATILSKTFGYIERTKAEVTPLWADEFIEKAVAAGVIEKANKIDASIHLTREQAIKYIAIAYDVDPVQGNTSFVDDDIIGTEYKPYVKAFQELGFIVGDNLDPTKSKFEPKGKYTRAAAMQVIDNTTSEITDISINGQIYNKSVIIRKSGVEIKDTTVKGHLIVGQGVGDGEVTLDNIIIDGSLIAYGGGSNSILVKGDNPIKSTVVNKPFGEPIHLNGKFNTITVTEGTKIIITGEVKNIIILGNAEVVIDGATIGSVEILGDNVNIIVKGSSNLNNITISANKVVISGNGIVDKVDVTEQAKTGVEILTIPTRVTVDKKAGAVKTINGIVNPGISIMTTTSNNTGSGSSSSSSSPSPGPKPSEESYTRGEWIQMLTEKIGISQSIVDTEHDYFYGDTEHSTNGLIIETANALGLLPQPNSEGYEDPNQDVPLFYPDKLASREFAAYTVAKAMGFDGVYELECKDAQQVTYPSEVAVIVLQDFLLLQNNRFKPSANLSLSDVQQIFLTIDLFNESLEINPSEFQESITLQDGVLEVTTTGYTVTDNGDGTYTVVVTRDENTEEIKVGGIFILPANDEFIGGIALKATSINEDSNALTIECVEPIIEEVIQDFSFIGIGTANIDNMSVAEGVNAEYDPNGSIDSSDDGQLSPFDIGGSTSLPGKLKYTIAKKSIGNSGVTVSGSFEIEIPDITVKAKGRIIGGFNLDELTVSITNKLKLSGKAKYDFGIPESSYDVSTGKPVSGSGKTELGRVPIALGATGLSLDFVIFLNVDVSGEVSISYTIVNTNGFQFKNGAFRLIKDYTTDFKALELNATAKFGIGLAVRVSLFSVWDLAGIDAHAGVGATAKFFLHTDVDPSLYCGNAAVYLYATVEIDEDTLLGWALDELFSLNWSWDIYDDDNSPLNLKLHIENAQMVPECTYGKGSLLGLIKDANTNLPIKGARVEFYNAKTGALVKTLYSARNRMNEILEGEFLINDLPAGSYRMKVKATGYQAYDQYIDVITGHRNVCEASLMIQRDSVVEDGTISFIITNALTGERLNSVDYIVRQGWNNISGTPILTGTANSSDDDISLVPGNYTFEFTKSDFINSFTNVVIQSGVDLYKEIAITPSTGIEITDNSFRVVLTWGEIPYDLDSHMYCVTSADSIAFHTLFADKTYDDGNGIIADLDLDDIYSYGPETSTVYKTDDTSKYSFYVHDYSNKRSSYSTELSNSGAQVKLYSGEGLVATFNILQNREGTLWHVFDYNASTGVIDFVNTLIYHGVPDETLPSAMGFIKNGVAPESAA